MMKFLEKINDQTFYPISAVLKIKYYNPPDLRFQNLPVKNVIKHNIKRMRNAYIIDTLTSVDIQEIVKIVGMVIQFYEGVICRKIFKVSLFKEVIEKLFNSRTKCKKE